MSDDLVIIFCHDNPEFPDRNFAYGKILDENENIVYCIESNCNKQEECPLKKSILNWK